MRPRTVFPLHTYWNGRQPNRLIALNPGQVKDGSGRGRRRPPSPNERGLGVGSVWAAEGPHPPECKRPRFFPMADERSKGTELLIACEENRSLRAMLVKGHPTRAARRLRLCSKTNGTGAILPPFRLMPAGLLLNEGMDRSTCQAESGSPDRTGPGRTRASP